MRSPCVRESAAPWSLKDLCGVYKYPQNICLEYEWSCLLVLYALNQRRLFFFNDTAPTEFYPLSLHDALPIWREPLPPPPDRGGQVVDERCPGKDEPADDRPLEDVPGHREGLAQSEPRRHRFTDALTEHQQIGRAHV